MLLQTVLLSGSGDPGYHFTSAGLAEVALCLANLTTGCLAGVGPSGVGVITTTNAVNGAVLRDRLVAVGLLNVQVEAGPSVEVGGQSEASSDASISVLKGSPALSAMLRSAAAATDPRLAAIEWLMGQVQPAGGQ